MEEGVFLHTDIDEAKACLEGVDLPADEAIMKLFAEDEGGLVFGQIDMTDDLHLGRLERVAYAQRDLGLGACGELYGLGGLGSRGVSLCLREGCGLLGTLYRGGVNGARASLWGLVGATLDLTIALLALTLVHKETIDDGVTTEGAAIDQLIHHHGVGGFLEELV